MAVESEGSNITAVWLMATSSLQDGANTASQPGEAQSHPVMLLQAAQLGAGAGLKESLKVYCSVKLRLR